MEDLSEFGFEPKILKPINPRKWKVNGTNDKGNATLAVGNADLREMWKDRLKSHVTNYTKKISKYSTNMQLMYGIILQNLDIKNVRTLIKSNRTFTSPYRDKDPIDLMKLLWKMGRKEQGVISPSKTLYHIVSRTL